jgi:hypothetical protein
MSLAERFADDISLEHSLIDRMRIRGQVLNLETITISTEHAAGDRRDDGDLRAVEHPLRNCERPSVGFGGVGDPRRARLGPARSASWTGAERVLDRRRACFAAFRNHRFPLRPVLQDA